MGRSLYPSPSEMVMSAMFDLQQERGTSLNDIVKYSKAKYGLSGSYLKSRISSALKRGLNCKILIRESGLYGLNKAICQIPPRDQENTTGSEIMDENKKGSLETNVNEPVKESGNQEENDTSSKKAPRRKKRTKDLFLCPECQLKVNKDGLTEVESAKSRRYELRPRKTPSKTGGGKGRASPNPAEVQKDGEKRQKTHWKNFLKMGISFRRRRPNKT